LLESFSLPYPSMLQTSVVPEPFALEHTCLCALEIFVRGLFAGWAVKGQ
jgi:hypothetical protein